MVELSKTMHQKYDNCLPGFSVHGIFQARILEWIAMFSSRVSSQPRNQIHVSCISCICRWILYHCTTWEALTRMPLSQKQKTSIGEDVGKLESLYTVGENVKWCNHMKTRTKGPQKIKNRIVI